MAEVETGEPNANEMVATKDVSTVTDDSQVAPIEIDASGQAPSVAQAPKPQAEAQTEAPQEQAAAP